ncbi:MAG: phytanoyl-CoA dioxygenase family protein [Caldilineaceae bacterium]|nr:phytanoyl-CoA dioxygenase family protein [Caldilineaceae bacterium]
MSSSDWALTEPQRNFFETFGYLGFPGLMADRAAEIDAAFEAIWTERGGGHNGKPHEGTARSCIVPFIDQSAMLSSLIDDPRIHGIATSLLGEDFNYMGSDGNYYVGDTRWHSDGWHPEIRHVKIAFYLDPLTADSGALRVIPGSHRLGEGFADHLQSTIRQSDELWGMAGNQCRPLRWKRSPATCSASTTTPSTRLLAAAKRGACSPSTCASAIPMKSSTTCATTLAARLAFGSIASMVPKWWARLGQSACATWNRSWPMTAIWPNSRARRAKPCPSRRAASVQMKNLEYLANCGQLILWRH